ncbi:hypothetical protein E3N88_38470 [Mikania micrantha]|uniref:Kinesin motor domain-containing protein n=1 Tax=Mikania micrantha TaxID=192012 RepID=A0A5N6LU43_9ASTR|nr:hypothetical protein E3N88_38470 [Mikania micrantha]
MANSNLPRRIIKQNEVQVSVDPHVKEDAFQSVGGPMVKSAMAGYNTLVLAYGQAMMLLTHISHLDSARLSLYVRLNLLC